MAVEAGTVEYKVGLNTRGLVGQQNRAFNSMKRWGAKINSWGNRIGGLLGAGLGFSLFSGAIQGWKSLESSLRQVGALTQGATNLKKLRKAADELSNTFGNEASESVDAFYQSISAGFSQKDAYNLIKFANNLAAAAAASHEKMDARGAVNALTTVLNAFGKSASFAEEYSNLLTNAVKYGKTSINELAGTISTVAPIASAMGMSLEELLITISALTQGGIGTARAITGIRSVLNELANPTTDAGKALQNNLGFGLAEAFDKGMSLTEIFRDGLLPAVDGNSQGFINLFGNIRAATAAMALANNNFQLATQVQKGFKNSINATSKSAQEFINNPLTRFNASVKQIIGVVVDLIHQLGGLGNVIVWLLGIFAAFKVGGLIAKLVALKIAWAAVAVAKTAAQSGIAAPIAVAATVAAIGAGLAAVGAIGATIFAGSKFNQKLTLPKVGSFNKSNIQNKNEIVVNVNSTGSTATSNGAKFQVQSNYGSN